MVSKSDQLLIVVSILEGERPRTCFCSCCFLYFESGVGASLCELKILVIFAFVVPTDLFKVVLVRSVR